MKAGSQVGTLCDVSASSWSRIVNWHPAKEMGNGDKWHHISCLFWKGFLLVFFIFIIIFD